MTVPNVLVVTVDCLRRDRVSAYGYPSATTPSFDREIATGFHASFAHAASSWTAPSVASLFTGRYPYGHGGGLLAGEPKHLSRDSLPTALPDDIPILQELLPDHDNAAFLAVWSASLPFGNRLGLVEAKDRSADRVVRRALRWISEQSSSWLCWVHLREPHDPLHVPRALRSHFGPIGRYGETRDWRFTERTADGESDAFAAYREHRERLYDAAVLTADRAIEGLLERVPPGTIVVLTADHGEEMWEHRDEEIASLPDPRGLAGVGHGHAMWQEVLLVPLVFRGIGQAEVGTPTSLVDVFPTILQALDVDAPDVDGSSLLGEQPSNRVVFAEGVAYGIEQRVAIDARHSLIMAPGFERLGRLEPTTHLDVGPSVDLAARDVLGAALDGRPAPANGVPVGSTAEIERHLRSLGYIE